MDRGGLQGEGLWAGHDVDYSPVIEAVMDRYTASDAPGRDALPLITIHPALDAAEQRAPAPSSVSSRLTPATRSAR
ncbi:hypothetical protein GCM10009677_20160 [Sphaerisporangium rubeum]